MSDAVTPDPHAAATALAPSETTPPGCPPPIGWQQVLSEFRATATPWSVARNGYELTGRVIGSGPPLYFLCGIGGTHELYALLAWLLKGEFRCVLIDYPGGPGNVKFPNGLTAEDLANDLFAAADFHLDATFDVYATSFGTVVALTALLANPARIEHVVLQGGFAYRRLATTERLLLAMLRWMPGSARHIPGRSLIQTANHRPWFSVLDPTRFQFVQEDTGRVPIRALANRAAILRKLDLRPRLKEITRPVLLIRSEGEGLVAEACHHDLEAGLPHARTEYFAGCGHLPYLTHPHRVATLLREYLLPAPETPAEVCCSDQSCSD